MDSDVEIAKLRRSLQEERRKSTRNEMVIRDLRQTVGHLQATAVERYPALQRSREERDKFQMEAHNYAEQRDTAQGKLAAVTQIAQTQKELHDAELDKVLKSNALLERKSIDLAAELDRKTSKEELDKAQLQQALELNAKLEVQTRDLTAELEKKTTKEELNDAQLQQALELNAKLEVQNRDLTAELEKKTTKEELDNAQLQESLELDAKLEVQNRDLTAELEKKKLNDAQPQQARESTERLEVQNRDLTAELEKKTTKEELNDAQPQQARESTEKLVVQNRDLTAELEKKTTKEELNDAQLQQARESTEKLAAENKDLAAKLERETKKYNNLTKYYAKEIRDYRVSFQVFMENINHADEEITQLKEAIEGHRVATLELIDNFERMEQLSDRQQIELQGLQSENATLIEEIEQLQLIRLARDADQPTVINRQLIEQAQSGALLAIMAAPDKPLSTADPAESDHQPFTKPSATTGAPGDRRSVSLPIPDTNEQNEEVRNERFSYIPVPTGVYNQPQSASEQDELAAYGLCDYDSDWTHRCDTLEPEIESKADHYSESNALDKDPNGASQGPIWPDTEGDWDFRSNPAEPNVKSKFDEQTLLSKTHEELQRYICELHLEIETIQRFQNHELELREMDHNHELRALAEHKDAAYIVQMEALAQKKDQELQRHMAAGLAIEKDRDRSNAKVKALAIYVNKLREIVRRTNEANIPTNPQRIKRDEMWAKILDAQDQPEEQRRLMAELRAAVEDEFSMAFLLYHDVAERECRSYADARESDRIALFCEEEVKCVRLLLEEAFENQEALIIRAERAERDAVTSECRSERHQAKIYVDYYRQLQHERETGEVPTLELAVLRDQLAKYESLVDGAQDQVDVYRVKFQETQRELQSKRRELSEQRAQVATLQEKLLEAEDEQNQQHLNGDDELEDLKETVSHYERQSGLDQAQITKLKTELRSCQDITAQREGEIGVLNKKNADLSARCEELVSKQEDLAQHVEALKSECNAVQELLQTTLHEKEGLKSECNAVQELLQAAIQEKEELKSECTNAQRAAHEFRNENIMMHEERKRMSLNPSRRDSVNVIPEELRSPALRQSVLMHQESLRGHAQRSSLSSAIDGLTPSSPGGRFVSSPAQLPNPRFPIGTGPRGRISSPLQPSFNRRSSRIGRPEYDTRNPRPLLLASSIQGLRSSSTPNPIASIATPPVKPILNGEDAGTQNPVQAPRAEVGKGVSAPGGESSAPAAVDALKESDKQTGLVKGGPLDNPKLRASSASSVVAASKLRESSSVMNQAQDPFIQVDNVALSLAETLPNKGTIQAQALDSSARSAAENSVHSRAGELSASARVGISHPEASVISPTRTRAVSEGTGTSPVKQTTGFRCNLEGIPEVPVRVVQPEVGLSRLPVRKGPLKFGERFPIAVSKRIGSFPLNAPANPSPLSNSFRYPSIPEFPPAEETEPKVRADRQPATRLVKIGPTPLRAAQTSQDSLSGFKLNISLPVVASAAASSTPKPQKASGLPIAITLRSVSQGTPGGARISSALPRPASRATARSVSQPKPLAETTNVTKTLARVAKTANSDKPAELVEPIESIKMNDPFGRKPPFTPTKGLAFEDDDSVYPSSPPVDLRKVNQMNQTNQQTRSFNNPRTPPRIPVAPSKKRADQTRRPANDPKTSASSNIFRNDVASLTPSMLRRPENFSFGDGSIPKILRGGLNKEGTVSTPINEPEAGQKPTKYPRLRIPGENDEPKSPENVNPKGNNLRIKTSNPIEATAKVELTVSEPSRYTPFKRESDISTLPSQRKAQQISPPSIIGVKRKTLPRVDSVSADTGASARNVVLDPETTHTASIPAPRAISDEKTKTIHTAHLIPRLNKVAELASKYKSLEAESSSPLLSGPINGRFPSMVINTRSASNQSAKSGPSDLIRKKQEAIVGSLGYIPGHNAIPYRGVAEEDEEKSFPRSGVAQEFRSLANQRSKAADQIISSSKPIAHHGPGSDCRFGASKGSDPQPSSRTTDADLIGGFKEANKVAPYQRTQKDERVGRVASRRGSNQANSNMQRPNLDVKEGGRTPSSHGRREPNQFQLQPSLKEPIPGLSRTVWEPATRTGPDVMSYSRGVEDAPARAYQSGRIQGFSAAAALVEEEQASRGAVSAYTPGYTPIVPEQAPILDPLPSHIRGFIQDRPFPAAYDQDVGEPPSQAPSFSPEKKAWSYIPGEGAGSVVENSLQLNDSIYDSPSNYDRSSLPPSIISERRKKSRVSVFSVDSDYDPNYDPRMANALSPPSKAAPSHASTIPSVSTVSTGILNTKKSTDKPRSIFTGMFSDRDNASEKSFAEQILRGNASDGSKNPTGHIKKSPLFGKFPDIKEKLTPKMSGGSWGKKALREIKRQTSRVFSGKKKEFPYREPVFRSSSPYDPATFGTFVPPKEEDDFATPRRNPTIRKSSPTPKARDSERGGDLAEEGTPTKRGATTQELPSSVGGLTSSKTEQLLARGITFDIRRIYSEAQTGLYDMPAGEGVSVSSSEETGTPIFDEEMRRRDEKRSS